MTVNAVDPEIGARIYSWVRDGKVIYRGIDAAKLLLERQLEAIAALKAHGIVVKVNTIVIPGINDHHVVEVARKDGGAWGGHPELHDHVPEPGHAVRETLASRTSKSMTEVRSERRENHPSDETLHQVQSRCSGFVGGRPFVGIQGMPLRLFANPLNQL